MLLATEQFTRPVSGRLPSRLHSQLHLFGIIGQAELVMFWPGFLRDGRGTEDDVAALVRSPQAALEIVGSAEDQ